MRYGEIMQDQVSASVDKNLAASIRSLEETLKEETLRGDGSKYLIVSIARDDSLALGNTIIEIDRELRRTISIYEESGLTEGDIVEELKFSHSDSFVQEPAALNRKSRDAVVSYDPSSLDLSSGGVTGRRN